MKPKVKPGHEMDAKCSACGSYLFHGDCSKCRASKPQTYPPLDWKPGDGMPNAPDPYGKNDSDPANKP